MPENVGEFLSIEDVDEMQVPSQRVSIKIESENSVFDVDKIDFPLECCSQGCVKGKSLI